jgi:hypothetical protein
MVLGETDREDGGLLDEVGVEVGVPRAGGGRVQY